MKARRFFVCVGASAALLLIGAATSLAGAPDEAGAVVIEFNAAVSSRSLDKATSYFAPGSVQFSLRPSHTGLGAQRPDLTADLRAHWSMIGPVLFAATKAYTRKAEIIGSRTEGDIATVWARITTETVRADKPGTTRDSFVELYLLVRKDGTWKIGAMADNRSPNDVGLGGGKP